MARMLSALCLFWVVALGAPVSEVRAADRPNLILIIADDMAWDDCGAYGHPRIQTPHLDRMAKQGMRFDRAFLTCSSCSPSRCSIITGRYPHSTGAHQLHLPLPGDQVTFPELLRASGYWTAAAGKWHLGEATKPKFDLVKEGGGKSGCENWLPVLQERPKDKPFFLWLASSDPHRGYEPAIIPEPHQPMEAVVPPYLPDIRETREDLAQYYDEITRLDGFVGRVLGELDKEGLASNTFVLFISDNGRPFPRCKTTVYDSGVRTPWIVRWPDHVKAGNTCGELVSSVDIAPTFLALAGLPPAETFQGVNFAPLLGNPIAPVRRYIHAEHNWHDFDDHQRAVRTQRHKYIRTWYTDLPQTPPADAVRSPTFDVMRLLRDRGFLVGEKLACFTTPRPAEELYDMDSDPHELRNLSDHPAYASVLREMREEMDRWREATADKVPEKRRPDEFDRETGERLNAGKRKGKQK